MSPFPKLSVVPEIWEMGMLIGTVAAAHFFFPYTLLSARSGGAACLHTLGNPAGAVKEGVWGCIL